MNDKIVLVTGGSSGIGLGIAQAFASEGCRVAIAGRSQEKLDQAANPQNTPHILHGHVCDVSDRSQVAELFVWLDKALGSIDILVNSAGINVTNRSMDTIDPDDIAACVVAVAKLPPRAIVPELVITPPHMMLD